MENLQFDGCDLVALAKEYGTPLYVMSEDRIVSNIHELKSCFDEQYPRCHTYYASKAFLTKDMIRIAKEAGIGLDVVSGGELYGAMSLQFPPDKLMFHGSGKSVDEVTMGIDYNVGRFVCDSLDEILLINEIAAKKNKVQKILIRVSPGVDSHTHEYIATASVDSKFGVPLTTMEDVIAKVITLQNIELSGFHFHVGSQLLENDSHLMAIDIMLELIQKLHEKFQFITKEFDLGGGFGVYYTKEDDVKPVDYFITPMVARIDAFFAQHQMERPDLFVEPGRWIVGEAGMTLYTITGTKEIPGIRTYASIDGGMPDNIRPALYQAVYEAEVANKMHEEKTQVVTIAGKCCESGDILIRDLKTPPLMRGDILAVKSTGAYNYSMANNYNKNGTPAVVMLKDGKARLSVRRQTLEDLYQYDV